MASVGAISAPIMHRTAKSMANLTPSHMVIYSQLSACSGEMEPFKDHPSIPGWLTSLRNKS